MDKRWPFNGGALYTRVLAIELYKSTLVIIHSNSIIMKVLLILALAFTLSNGFDTCDSQPGTMCSPLSNCLNDGGTVLPFFNFDCGSVVCCQGNLYC